MKEKSKNLKVSYHYEPNPLHLASAFDFLVEHFKRNESKLLEKLKREVVINREGGRIK